MKRDLKWCAAAGAVIPLALLIIKYIELFFNNQAIPYAGFYGFYLWPTSLLLLGQPGGFSLHVFVWLVVSIAANAGLYTFVGLLIVGILRMCRRVHPDSV